MPTTASPPPRPVSLDDVELRRSRRLPGRPGRGRWLRWTERLLLVGGLLCLGAYLAVKLEARAVDAYQTWRLERALERRPVAEALPAVLPVEEEREGREAMDGMDGMDAMDAGEAEPLAAAASPPEPEPASFLDAGRLVGKLEIARLGVEAIVLEGIDGRTLRRGVGHVPGTARPGEPGNVGLAGHRDTFFRELRDVRTDDLITLDTPGGTHRYRVESTLVVEPDAVEVLGDYGDDRLTLVTCYPFHFIGRAPLRFIVQARPI